MSRMQTGMVLSVKFFSQVSLRLLEHVQNADWNGFVVCHVFFEAVRTCPEHRLEWFCHSRFCSLSCFFESVRTCPECRLEWFSQSVVVFSFLFSPLDVRTHPEYRMECFVKVLLFVMFL